MTQKKSPIVLLLSGGDWFDASVDVRVPPDGADFKADIDDYPGYKTSGMWLRDWLVTHRSWREHTEDELYEHWE